ncbi:MAG: type II CAAX endopeptidase family protein [Bacilli bacterium]
MRRSHIYVILLFIGMQLSGYVVLPIVEFFGLTKETHPVLLQTVMLSYTIISYIIALVISIFILYRDRKDGYRSVLGEGEPYRIGKGSLLIVGGFSLAWFAQIIAGLIERLLFDVPTGSDNTKMFIDIIRAYPIFILIPVLLAPIYEEIVFRFILLRVFMKRMNWVFASLLSSFIFGAVHWEWEHILIYSAIGLVFAWLYKKSKRIYVPIAVHCIMNSITLLVQMNLEPIQNFLENLPE